MHSKSCFLKFDRIDLSKTLRDGATAIAASIATSLLLNIQMIQDAVIPILADYLGLTTTSLLYPLLTAIITVLFVAVRRWLTDHTNINTNERIKGKR